MSKQPTTFANFISLPYEERQFIRIIPDRPPQDAAQQFSPNQANFSAAAGAGAGFAVGAAEAFASDNEGRIDPKVAAALAASFVAAVLILEYSKRQRKVAEVERWIASALLTFPPGHPKVDAVYAGNPVVPELYYPVEEFHPHVVAHKLRELRALLSSLAARRVSIVAERKTLDKRKGSISGTGGAVPTTVTGNVSSKSGDHATWKYEAYYSPSAPPCLHDDRHWFDHEPLWQSLAEDRLKHGLLQSSFTTFHSSDYGVDGGLRAQMLRKRWGLEGAWSDFQVVSWQVEAEFGPVTVAE